MARLEMSGFEGSISGGKALSDEALFDLGLQYASGRGVEPDLVAAHKWFNLAALKGNAAARAYRSEIASEMSRREISSAQRQAREWLARR